MAGQQIPMFIQNVSPKDKFGSALNQAWHKLANIVNSLVVQVSTVPSVGQVPTWNGNEWVPSLPGSGLPVFANNAAAVAGGLIAGQFYRSGADPDVVCVVH